MEQTNKNTISSLSSTPVTAPDGKKTSCSIFCAPLIIYIIISIIFAFGVYTLPAYDSEGKLSTSKKMTNAGLFLAIASFGGILFAFLCYKCWNTAAWILIILVFFGFLSSIFTLFAASLFLNIVSGIFGGGTKKIEIDIENSPAPSSSPSPSPTPTSAPSSGSYN